MLNSLVCIPPRAPKASLGARHTQTLNDLFDLQSRCPQWQAKWARAIRGVDRKGQFIYRGFTLTRTIKGVSVSRCGVLEIEEVAASLESSNKDLFRACHRDLATMIDTLVHARNKDHALLAGLEKVLLAQFPGDAAWTHLIRHRVGMLQSASKSRKHDAAIYPRILAPRRNALVLVKDAKGQWKTRKGSSVDRVLAASSQERKVAISVLIGLPGLQRVELPTDMDFAALYEVAEQVSKALKSRHPAPTAARKQRKAWSLAVRRIRGMGLNGCFDAASQTIVVDPRHLDSVRHEVCHWLLGHDVSTRSGGSIGKDEAEVHALEARIFP